MHSNLLRENMSLFLVTHYHPEEKHKQYYYLTLLWV
jgi:hypothetical protein